MAEILETEKYKDKMFINPLSEVMLGYSTSFQYLLYAHISF